MSDTKKNTSLGPRTIGLFFLITGLYGFLFSAVYFLALGNFLTAIAAAIVFGLTINAGYLLLTEKELGLKRAKWVSALQIISFNFAGFSYVFITGVRLGFHIDQFGIGGDLYFTTVCRFYHIQGSGYSSLAINFVALALFFYFDKIQKAKEREERLAGITAALEQPVTKKEITKKQSPKKETAIKTEDHSRGGRPH